MLLSHRALFTANRLPAVRARSIGHAGKFWHYSTESATSTAAPLAKDAPVSDPLKGEFSTSPSATEAVRKTYSEISKKRLSENSKARESDAGSYTPWKPYNKDGPSITHTTSPWKSPPAKKEYSQSSQKLSPPKTAPTPPAPEPLLAKEPTESSDEPEAPRHPVEYTRSTVDINWHESFYGISTKVVTPKQHAILARPVETEDIEVKPDGIVYLPEVKYRRRLNEAFGPMGWGMVPRGEPVVGRTIVTREYALIVDGRYVFNHCAPTNQPKRKKKKKKEKKARIY